MSYNSGAIGGWLAPLMNSVEMRRPRYDPLAKESKEKGFCNYALWMCRRIPWLVRSIPCTGTFLRSIHGGNRPPLLEVLEWQDAGRGLWRAASFTGSLLAHQRRMDPFDRPLRQEEHKSSGVPLSERHHWFATRSACPSEVLAFLDELPWATVGSSGQATCNLINPSFR